MGVEYRNDLLGHLHALNPARPPSNCHSGHAGSERDEDRPSDSVAAAELKALEANVGYCLPVLSTFEDDPAAVLDLMPDSVEACEVVADAALGLVDSRRWPPAWAVLGQLSSTGAWWGPAAVWP